MNMLCSLLFATFLATPGVSIIQIHGSLGKSEQQESLARHDSSQSNRYPMEHFFAEPRITFEPSIRVPDSLRPLHHKVKVLVRVRVDSTGRTSNPVVLRSSDQRFNKVAMKYALQYRLDVRPTFKTYKQRWFWVAIPIIFREPTTKEVRPR